MVYDPVMDSQWNGSEIAIVGMACRFPGAADPAAFWRNLRDGVESITFLSDADLLAANVDPAALRDPSYVKAAPLLNAVDTFDAAFFGYTPTEAEIMDPQQRVLLECAWQALEHAGYNPASYGGAIGVYTGAKTNTYLYHLAANRELLKSFDFLQLVLGGDLALLSTRISYKFNLKGPSYAVQTACSTALVAVHLACQSLLIDECQMALAGAVAINVPPVAGYQHQEGGILSPDGHCRAFDAQAAGTVFGSGVGMVVLKRLEDALADGDTIHAIIRGSATNNDGSFKASFTAPSVDGQAAVIREALAAADVDAGTIGYVEAHGTGTQLGDPIEVLALTQAFRASTDKTGFCPIGSVKTNLGHLDAAAGMSSLIKTVLALKHGQIPASLHYEKPNPQINFAESPFFVNTTLTDWPTRDWPRRAGVSAFGFGGTNAHLILEEAPAPRLTSPAQPWQLLILSARSGAALEAATGNLATALQQPDTNLADVAYTLQLGRQPFAQRRFLVCSDHADASAALAAGDPERLVTGETSTSQRPVVFMFSGQGAQYPGMARELYVHEPRFRAPVDRCCALLAPHLGLDLRSLLFGEPGAATQLTETQYAQPALFVIEYALAQLWMAWGIEPQAMIGHSIGEYVAACLAGVFTLEDALSLVAARGRLMQQQPSGAMLAVSLPEAELLPLLGNELALAAVNGPAQCVAAGPAEATAALQALLSQRGVQQRPLHTSHAFHSAMMDPLLETFTALVRGVALHPPQRPYLSNVSGSWITAEQATDPVYWANHLRQTVRFADGIAELLQVPARVLLEVGPGTTLSAFAKQHPNQQVVLASLPHPQDRRSDQAVLLGALGRLWLAGVSIDWSRLYEGQTRQRVPLPTYPFERQRYWIAPDMGSTLAQRPLTQERRADLADWFYQPSWQPAPVPSAPAQAAQHWLIMLDAGGLGAQLAELLVQQGQRVTRVQAGLALQQLEQDSYTLDPSDPAGYLALLDQLRAAGHAPQRIVQLWGLPTPTASQPEQEALAQAQERGFGSLLWLAQALGARGHSSATQIDVLIGAAQAVSGQEQLRPAQALALGPCRVIPQEYPNITCRSIDILPEQVASDPATLAAQLLAELLAPPDELSVAYRAGQRLVQRYVALPTSAPSGPPACLRQGGVYLITGGLGQLGATLAEYLARAVQARLVLVGRTALPERADWPSWLADHPPLDATSLKIRRIQALEELGAEVLLCNADVASPEELQAVVATTLECFGALHGVIHGAGTARGSWFTAIPETGRPQIDWHFHPKVYGLLALEQALRGLTLDFCMLQSSLASVLGGLGNIAYAAANLFMDSFARRQDQAGGTRWLSVDWDSWHQPTPEGQPIGATLVELAITPPEGVAVFERILALPDQPQVVISTGDLHARIDQWIKLTALRSPMPRGTTTAPLGVRTDRAELERQIAAIWRSVLGLATVGLHDNFFDLGGTSLSGMQLISELRRALDVQIAPVTLFEAPTVSALARYLSPESASQPLAQPARPTSDESAPAGIAIIGMAGRFPGATGIDAFWENLCQGREAITHFSEAELAAAGVAPELLSDPSYVMARPLLDEVATFDAGFFGYSPREAELMDPQHRLFLECAWQALEDAGYAAEPGRGAVGIYAGASISTYLLQLYANPALASTLDPLQAIIGNDKDSLTTSVSYKLNLTGPSMAVQTFCSTALVAVHLACQSLRRGECAIALAGGASIVVPQQSGYRYQEESILSPDGHCRPFDAQANGTLFGNGVGLVALKRLEDALRDGDQIYAVIKGSAINNDGALKVGYTAPSVDGQASVISEALADAGVAAETIGYVEAHGTGTALGDPIEVAALTKAFRQHTSQQGFCALGSVKGNIGHLDRAAGVAALIKAALALRQGQIPPVMHFDTPNPRIDFASSPFFVNQQLIDWPNSDGPRRAGVSALGFGGTNAHLVLEQAPPRPASGDARPWQLLTISARSGPALEAATANLVSFFQRNPAASLADAAYTLQVGRRGFGHRRALVCQDREDALALLQAGHPQRALTGVADGAARPIVFLFPGQGAQYVDMARGLYASEPRFRADVDACCELLQPELGLDLRTLLFPDEQAAPLADRPSNGSGDSHAAALNQTQYAQPALFVVEYALAQLWQSWGVQPQALIGHSIGEYVAATLAGVFSLADALRLAAARGRLLQSLPPGAMLSVALAEHVLRPLLPPELSLAAANGPAQCVVSGPLAAVAAFEQQLTARGQSYRRLHTSHAFHSSMLEPILEPFAAVLRGMQLQPPRIRYVSNVTGDWINEADATDPAYWVRHMRQTVYFAAGLQTLAQLEAPILLEVGPGRTLSALVKQQPDLAARSTAISSLRHPQDSADDAATLLLALARLWTLGVPIDWRGFAAHQQRHRISLPTYPFERQRYWIEPADYAPALVGHAVIAARQAERDWVAIPSWARAAPPRPAPAQAAMTQPWLIFADAAGLAATVTRTIEQAGTPVISVSPAARYARISAHAYQLDPRRAADYATLLADLAAAGLLPTVVLHAWAVGPAATATPQQLGCDSLLALAQAAAARQLPLRIWAVANQLHDIRGDEEIVPEQATLVTACHAIGQRYPQIACHCLDMACAPATLGRSAAQIIAEVQANAPDLLVAYRGTHRWAPTIQPLQLDPGALAAADQAPQTYLITGGLEGSGWAFAQHLALAGPAQLVLVEPEALPDRTSWPRWLTNEVEQLIDAAALATYAQSQPSFGLDLAAAAHEIGSQEAQIAQALQIATPAPGLEAAVDTLCASYIYWYFAETIDLTPGRRYTRTGLRQQLGIIPKFEKFYNYFLAVLAEEQIVALEGEEVIFQKPASAVADPTLLRRELERRFPTASASLWALEHCARHYGQALTGAVEPVSVLYPNGSSEMLMTVTESQASYSNTRIYTMLIAQLIAQAAARSDGRTLRILEIGAGDGKLTWPLVAELRGLPIEYHFTDIGRSFVINAEKHAQHEGLDFMRMGVLDVSQEPQPQGYAPYSFDIILALDVVHATERIGETLERLRRLLVPRGAMLLLEPTRVQRWVTMIWGLADGWWYFSDSELRTISPLLRPEQWEQALSQHGFASAQVFPQGAEPRRSADHSLIVVQQPRELSAPDYRRRLLEQLYAAERETQQRIRRIDALEQLGAQVVLGVADPRDEAALRGLLAEAQTRFGTIDRVIHALEPARGPADDPAQLRAAMDQVIALDRLLSTQGTTSGLLLSSLAALSGQPAADQAAMLGRFNNAFASHSQTRPLRWTSVNWDHGPASGERVVLGSHAGGSIFPQLLAADGIPQIIVSPHDLAGEAAQWNWPPPAAISEATGHARPLLDNEYVAPSTATEQQLAALWSEVLGIGQIGIHDSFLELGGDSLIATQLMSRVRDTFQIDLPLRKLFEAISIAGLAQAIDEQRAAHEDEEAMEILRMLAAISDDEADREIAKRQSPISQKELSEG